MEIPLHLLCLADGNEFMPSKRILKFLLALSTMQKSMACSISFHGTKETPLRPSRKNWLNLESIVLSLRVLLGAVSSPDPDCKTSLTSLGPGYRSDSVFDLSKMEPYNMMDILKPFHQMTENVILYLPRTSDLRQLTKTLGNGKKVTVVHYCMEGASKVFARIRLNCPMLNVHRHYALTLGSLTY